MPVMLWGMGALDFAGGTVVHINAGIAGLVGCLMIGKRIGYGKEAMPPHSLTMTMIGASLLWVGWFGFNAGSNLEANGVTAVAFINTFVATAAAAVAWAVVEQIHHGKPSMLGAATGRGCRSRRDHPGFGLRRADDLDRARLHGVADLLLLRHHGEEQAQVRRLRSTCSASTASAVSSARSVTGIVADPALGGQGFFDYTVFPAGVGTYDMGAQVHHPDQGGGC
jgi:Amt family ammonium transporter